MNTDFIKGVVVPMITPIDKDELIDEAAIRSQVDYVIDGGVSGILLFGSNGEFYVVEEGRDGERLKDRCRSGGRWTRSGILRHRCYQHQKVRSSCKDGSSKRRSKRICSAADVLKAN